jgi:hypothetical protein
LPNGLPDTWSEQDIFIVMPSLSTWIWYVDDQHLANRLVQFIYQCGMAMSDWVGMVG